VTGQEQGEAARTIAAGLGVPELFARILVARGIADTREAETYLYPKLTDLSEPSLLPDVERGVLRFIEAIKKQQRICLYGDYDADGIASVRLVAGFLRHLGIEPMIYIPTREEGYGLNRKGLEKIKGDGADLLVCLDCASTNVTEVEWAQRAGMDVIIIDHHEVGAELPAAHAIINPKRKDSVFPTRELAACGVTFFFLLALRRALYGTGTMKDPMNLKKELDIVALGTMGDMVPLKGDNRVLVRFGMEMMNRHPRAWLKAFLRQNLLSRSRGIDEQAINFVIVPRINATGRVGEPTTSLKFLLSEDPSESQEYLGRLQEANRLRQRIEEQILSETVALVKGGNPDAMSSIVLYDEGWHIGVIGIVAQRLVEMYGKPVVIITEVDGLWKGSGRGGGSIDLHEAMIQLSPLLERFGGHKHACGITIRGEQLAPFREAFEKTVAGMDSQKVGREVFFDVTADFDQLTGDVVECLKLMSPFGMGNPRPHFLLPATGVSVNNRFLKASDGKSRTWYGSCSGSLSIPDGPPFFLVVSPVIREESGERFIHLHVKDVLPSSPQ
jgi:single-stranded-DNA-specific exonuclease